MTQLVASPQAVRRATGRILSLSWAPYSAARHEFLAALCPEEDGGFSVFAANIPGVVSQGETVDEAKANIADAFLGMLEACKKRGQSLPYSPEPVVEMTPACHRLWVTVDG